MQENTLPVLPLRDVVVYPHVIVPLFVGREKSIAALNIANDNQQELLLIPQKDASIRDPEIVDLTPGRHRRPHRTNGKTLRRHR